MRSCLKTKKKKNQARCGGYTPFISRLGRQRQIDCCEEVRASLVYIMSSRPANQGYIVRPCLKERDRGNKGGGDDSVIRNNLKYKQEDLSSNPQYPC